MNVRLNSRFELSETLQGSDLPLCVTVHTLALPEFNDMPAPDSVMRVLLPSCLKLKEGVNTIVAVVDDAFTLDANAMTRPFNHEMAGNLPVFVESMTCTGDRLKSFEVPALTVSCA